MKRFALTLSALCALSGLLASAERSPIVLERAKTMNSYEENGVRRQELSGDVWITKDSLSVTCQQAKYYPDSGLLIFQKFVEFRQPQRTLYADRVTYNERTEEVEANGHVRIYQDSLQIRSDRALYRERFKNGYFYDNVRVKDDSRNIDLRGRLGFFDHEREYARVTGSPVLTERDSALTVLTRILADTIEYFGQEKIARATGSVVANRDSLVSFGTQLVYHSDSSFAEMIGEPRAHQDRNTVQGDTLRLFFADQDLNQVEVIGHAFATSPADSLQPEPLNRMEGRRMLLSVDQGIVDRLTVIGNAIATYHVRENGEPRGLNVTSGDLLEVFFQDSRISHIQVKGGTQGDYTPQRLVEKANRNDRDRE